MSDTFDVVVRRSPPVPPEQARRAWSEADLVRLWLRNHCQEDHQSWPAKGPYSRHVSEASRRRRMDAYARRSCCEVDR
jgi:hypothetical protein